MNTNFFKISGQGTNNFVGMCIPKLLTDEQKDKRFEIAKKTFVDNGDGDFKQMAVVLDLRWDQNQTIHFRFLNGTSVQKAKAERWINFWEDYVNLKFVFDQSPTAEVRISFYDGQNFKDQGSWSYIGRECTLAPPGEATMNFGWLDDNTDDAEWERVVTHESAHMLGALHENQMAYSGINWNKDAVYKYFEGPPNNWNKQDVDDNVLNVVPDVGLAHTPYQSTSIMAYEIPGQFIVGGVGIPGGTIPTDLDKQFMASMYPKNNIDPNPVVTIDRLVVGGPNFAGVTPKGNKLQVPLTIDESSVYVINTFPANTWINVFKKATSLKYGKGKLQIKLAAGVYNVNFRDENNKEKSFQANIKKV